MVILINIETAAEVETLLIDQIIGFVRLCQKMGVKQLEFMQGVYIAFVQRLKEEIARKGNKDLNIYSEWFKTHAVKSFIPSRDRKSNTSVYVRWSTHKYEISSPVEYAGLSARCLAWASLKGGISLGVSQASLGDNIYYEVKELQFNEDSPLTFTSLMFTKQEHSYNVDYLRWRYMKTGLAQGVAFPEHTTFGKHFHREVLPIIKESGWTNAQWVKDTRDGEAMFLPGLKYGSAQFHSLIRFVLRQAYSKFRYTIEDQNNFVVDVQRPIGAAAGKPTSKVKLYVTKQNVIHIRPCEQAADCTADESFSF